MTVTVYFEDSDKTYTIDFLRLAKQLRITEDQIKQAVQDILSKS